MRRTVSGTEPLRGARERPAGEPYLLGTDPEEGRRLATQHRAWAAAARDLWDRAGFGPGARLLDLGCGPGFAALDLARRVGAGGRVLAVDESSRFIEALAREAARLGLAHLTARVGQAEELRLVPGSLDGAFARWLFCFLRDPVPVVERIASGLRPGGRVVLWDYLNYRAARLEPPCAAFERVLAAVGKSWRRTGGDLDVGARLPGMLADAGCRVLELVPLVALARPGTPFWDWSRSFFFGYAPRLVGAGLLDKADRRAFESAWREREESAGAFFSTPPMIAVIAEKQ